MEYDFEKIFEELGIEPNELEYNYNPDDFAKSILSQCVEPCDISYAVSTQSYSVNEKVSVS